MPVDNEIVNFKRKHDDEEMDESSSNEEDMSEPESNDEEENEGEPSSTRVYLPSQETDSNVQLECDESAYIFYHTFKAGASCLSFDIVRDGLGDDRADKFPLTMTLVAGTQVEKAFANNLIVMKLNNINKPKASDSEEDESDDEESDEEEEHSKPMLECATMKHSGGVNRIRLSPNFGAPIVASWSEVGKVFLWDMSHPLEALNNCRLMTSYIQNNEAPSPIFSFSHQVEGYAMDWSPLTPGMLATGDCKKFIHLWKPLEGGKWHVDQKAYTAHSASVEDIQWSPHESNVMASCSVDKSIRIWDIRAAPHKACMLTNANAHDSDVNVISWNKFEPFILSGGDDAKLRVWDLRKFPDGAAVCTFKHHTAPITSVQWHPTDSSVFAASGADDQLTLWDLAVERDDEQEGAAPLSHEELTLPPQLLFIHQGQTEIKELHWHRQMPGVLTSTAQNGFNVFRTLSV